MANTVDGVESKGEAETELNSTLDSKGKSSERLDERGALNVPAEQGGTGQSDASDTGQGRGAEPRLLDLVDGQMGGDGALLSLSNEDFVTLRRRELVGRDATNSSQGSRSIVKNRGLRASAHSRNTDPLSKYLCGVS